MSISSPATSLESRVNTLLSTDTYKGKEISEMTVVEVAAQQVDCIARNVIGSSSTSHKSLDEMDLEPLDTIENKEQLQAFVKGILPQLASDKDVRTLTGRYIEKLESRFNVTISHTPDEPDHKKAHDISKTTVVDIPVGSERKTVHMRKQLGLTGPSNKVTIDEKGHQTRLDDSFRDLAMLIQTDDTIDAHINGTINTIAIHRKQPSGEYRKVYYDLTHDSEIQRLVFENSGVVIPDEKVSAFREKLNKIGKELDDVMEEISPSNREAPAANYSRHSVNNLNGIDPFTHVGPRVGKTLMDTNFFEKSILPLFKSRGLADPNGKLNKHGIRAYKEIAAAITLRKQESLQVSLKLKAAEKKLAQMEKNTNLNLLEVDSPQYRDIEKLKKDIKVLSQRRSELSQASDFTVAWMIVQMNTPVKVTYTGGTDVPITIREALEIKDAKFKVEGMDFETGGEDVTPLTFRQKLAAKATEGFNATVLKNTQGTFETDPHSEGFIKKRFRQKDLTTSEKLGGFEIGTMFFYPNMTEGDPDPTFRIQNQLRHERLGVTHSLSKDIPGGEWVKLAKHFVDIQETANPSAAPEKSVEAVNAHFGTGLFEQAESSRILQETKKMVDLFSFNPGEKTPENGLNIMRDNSMLYESRWFVKRWWDHGRGN
ncbi:MAG: hypothetical protein H7A42_00450 [Chlamydiales bacterium]|nr:hypothetical protein [Chlamydiales bacterium]